MKKYLLFAVACLFYACGGDSDSSTSPSTSSIGEGTILDVIDTEYRSGDLKSVVAYDSHEKDTLYLNVEEYDKDKNRYTFVEESTEDTVIAKLYDEYLKVFEVRYCSEKSSGDDKEGSSGSSSKSSSSGKSNGSSGNDSGDDNYATPNSSSSSSVSWYRGYGDAIAPEFSIVVENEEMRFDLSKMKMVDKRDGHEYPLKLSGTTLTMNANLNYEVKNSWCYNDYAKNCDRYGRLYTWYAAYQDNQYKACKPSNEQGVCPIGWYVNSNVVNGLYAGYRDDDGYFAHILELGMSWSPTSPSTAVVNQNCDYYYVYTSKTCSGDSCVSLGWYSDRMGKDDAISVSCVYQWPVVVPDSVKLPEAAAVPKYDWPKALPSYSGKYGELVDERDGNIYKTVDIGNQTWMAENLNYAIDSSFCMGGNSKDSCAKYAHMGRMYRWEQANGFDGYSINRSAVDWPIQGVCPNGWHIPTMAEWKTLFNYVLEATDGVYTSAPLYAKKWDETTEGGVDAFGFGLISSGHKHYYDIIYDYGFGYVEYMISDERETKEWLVRFAMPYSNLEGGIYYDDDNDDSYPHIRCIKGKGSHAVLPPEPESSSSSAPKSSSSSAPKSSSSSVAKSSSSVAPASSSAAKSSSSVAVSSAAESSSSAEEEPDSSADATIDSSAAAVDEIPESSASAEIPESSSDVTE